MSDPLPDPKAAQLRMLRALEEAAARIEALERGLHEPIAVIGLGCRFPGEARDAASFWRSLRDGVDAIGETPPDRWDAGAFFDAQPDQPGKICTRSGGYLSEVDRFDAAFFGISPREAAAMDPQQRLLLEVAHEALDGAGQLGDRLAENATGIFAGLTNNDYAHLLQRAAGDRPLDQYFITGNSPNAAAGRISYLLGLRGPSLVVDTACSSSLVAVHLACQSLRAGECRLALAGGVNLILSPDASVALSRARMLSPDGRCKTFDAAADGYGRGEGCGLVVLKRWSDAERDGDRVLALIRGSALNQDGPTGGFTVPSGAAQRALLERALAQARLAPADVDYVEAHGTGTALGDPIEINALADVFGAGRPAGRPLLVGSVKTNIGHLESASGAAGLIKAVLALWHGEIPAHLHFRHPNPHIAWEDLPVRVAAAHAAWPAAPRPRRAGVSSFGVSGTNAHLILEQAPAARAASALPAPRRRFRGERHWFAAPGAPAADNAFYYEVAWRPRTLAGSAAPAVQAAALREWIAAAGAPPDGAAYAGILGELEALSRRYARRAGAEVRADEVVPSHRRLFARLRDLAAETEPTEGDPAAEIARLRAACPAATVELTLLERCGARLADVLRGRCDPLTLLFPAGEGVTAADLYQHAPVARRMGELVRAAVAALRPARPLRVLEIGAGSGATTAAVLSALPAETEYVFTDVSPLFLAQARERFRAEPGLRCQALDIEEDPAAQGLPAGRFDLVIAANVLHATRDVRAALRHARSLLAADGRLILLEATRPLGFLDLIFGLTGGWWRFQDADLRPRHALLTPAGWRDAAGQSGFEAPEVFAFPSAEGEIFASQAVITARRREASGAWLLLADRRGVAAALAAALTRAGETCTLVHAGAPDAGGDAKALAIDPAVPGDYLRALGTAPAWRGVVHLWGLEDGDPRDDRPTASALLLAQALTVRPAPLWIATRGAIAAAPADAVPGLAAAPLWGLARSIAQEHPELQPVRIDLEPGAGPAEAAQALAAELLGPDGEDQIAHRGGLRWVARLARTTPAAGPAVALRADGTYLVVGGRGGLGLPLARWLSAHGARHLVLAGRGAPDAAAQELVAELAAAGTEVRLERADAAVAEELARVVVGITGSPWPLRGVIHAAGVLDDGVLRQLTGERLARVLAPKVAGAWNLHRLTLGQPVDFFVLFSSATALLGSPGQANHAAANAFLDALAPHRRAAGLPATSINWGAWEEIGAAAARRVGGRFLAQGIRTLSPAQGWAALERLLGSARIQTAVLPVDWPGVPAALTRSPFFREVRARPAAAAAPDAPALAGELAALAPGIRRSRLVAEIRRQVALILGLPGADQVDPTRGFFTLGMDSLTSVELRNRLQGALARALPAAAVFDHPTAESLAAFLASLWDEAPAAGTAALVAAPPRADADETASGVEAIAVIGIGLRLPGGADSPEALRELLRGRADAITEVPPGRWNLEEFYDPDPAAPGKMYARAGGFLDAVDQFDAGFFGVSPREAVAMDPQQRLLLETSWEALERAGIAPDALGGSATGVFVGISNHDYVERLLAAGVAKIDSYLGSGNAHSVAAGRLSYALGLHGPSLAVDTACSSSLVAVHLACQSLRLGECGLALAAGVNLLLSPTISINHSRARMLAPDGRCKAFDAAADGFVRSEGCGVVVLKRLADARRDGDHVLAVVAGSAVNQDGRTSGLTVPHGPSQQAVIRAALAQAGIAPGEVGFVEAHGTGTALGDPIEIGALAAVFGPHRPPGRPLLVGSIKTNVGHCESAAGIAGLIKAVLAVAHAEIPAHLHFRNPNPLIPWEQWPWLVVPTATVPWPAGGRRIAGVSSFGFGGTNAHVLIAAAPAPAPAAAPRGGEVLVLSAKDDAALAALAARYGQRLEGLPASAWPDVCHTAATGRARLPRRLALSAGGPDASEQLAAFARGETPAGIWTGVAGEWPKVAFLFSGQGGVYPGMGMELYAGCAAYRRAFAACAALVERHAGWDLLEAIDSADLLARTEYGQVALFAVEFSLAAVWQDWGLLPDAVVGHSAGEFAAACVAGRLALEQALPLVIVRARLMGALGEAGAMAAVTGTEADVAGVIARHGVELAAVNSPRQVVLTGARAALAAAVAELKAAGRRVQLLDVAQAYHSRQMEPMLPEFGRLAAEILADFVEPAKIPDPAVRFLSTVTAADPGDDLGGADYWARQIRRPVRFAEAVAALRGEGIGLLVEVGPRGILAALGQQTWPAGEGAWLTSLSPERADWEQMQESAGRAWVRGAPIDWREVDCDHRRPRLSLPTYPFQRRRHWCEEPPPPPTAYELFWEPAARAADAAAPAGSWRLAGGSPGLRRELARELARRGRITTDGGEPATAAVVFLADEAPGENPPAAAAAACEALRQLAHEHRRARSQARLWIVTRGAVAVRPGEGAALALAASPLWGFGKALALEYPEGFGGLLDLDPAAAPGEAARVVEGWLNPAPGEDQLALRGDVLWAPRLRPRPLPRTPAPVRGDGAYLVTGGLGVLGLRVAGWLAEQGARHLALVGRRPPSPAAEAEIARWRAAGARVTVLAADAADGAALARLLGALPPLRGVVHAAGVAGFAAAEELGAETLAAVLHPKIAGAWALHEATRNAPLDFFALFSSIASVWGSKGQAHYAAANQFLDALAQHRRALGLPATSINWGPWAGGGMAAGGAQEQLARLGIGALAPAEALAALGCALAAPTAQSVVARVDWARLRPAFEARGPRPLLANVGGAPAAAAESAPAEPGRLSAWAALAAPERRRRLEALAQATVGQVLRLPEGEVVPKRVGFSELGIDSLLAVEIRNRLAAALGLALPATLVFDQPEIERLARFLADQFEAAAPAATAAGADATAAARERIARLTEEEAEALLLKKLEEL